MKRVAVVAVCALVVGGWLGTQTTEAAIDTAVQFSSTGTGDGINNGALGGYDVTDINEFDWQSSGDAVIEDAMTASTANAGGFGGGYTSFTAWATAALAAPQFGPGAFAGSSVTFELHAQARLNDMLSGAAGSVLPGNISTDGTGGAGMIEVTGVLDGTESATYLGFGVMVFTGISGTYTWFVDNTPDSVVATGVGFDDGAAFLTGALTSVGGTFQFGVGGNVLLENTVTGYDSAWIQTDPTSNRPLVGTTFDTLISLVSPPNAGQPSDNGHEAAAVDAGDVIGDAPYVVLAEDLGFKADANSEFSATPEIPEPGTMILLGSGLLGMAGVGRRRGKKS